MTLNGSISGSALSASWSGGTGTFNPNANTLNAIYTPSAAEIAAGSVTLTLTTNDPAGSCGPASDQMKITINPNPTVQISLADACLSTAHLHATVTGGVAPYTFTSKKNGTAIGQRSSSRRCTMFYLSSTRWVFCYNCALASSARESPRIHTAGPRCLNFLHSRSSLFLITRSRHLRRMARALHSARLHNCALAGFMFLSSEEPSRNCHRCLAQRGGFAASRYRTRE